MKWIDFQCIADEQGLKSGDEIDAIEMRGKGFDISYTEKEIGYSCVIRIEETENPK